MSPQTFSRFQVVVLLSILPLCALENSLHRQKRFLYYPNGGTFKLVIGFAIPVQLGLKQSMACGWNLQFQYAEPQTTNNTRIYPPIVGRSREKREDFVSDRALAYRGFEALLSRYCLLNFKWVLI
ncbi:hypothetical protein BDFB_012806 [Asbolus verrucosus]|uniref:Secreted protein n=1 Tax=Asbolus verrucosus TaxID=1661398 RepID=A0A482VQZ6_ASBVE|nr:hypothetical protein BDFB_012806 [Asbolus verrucosus]